MRDYEKKGRPYSEEHLEEAMSRVKSGSLSLRKAAEEYNVPRSTMARKLNSGLSAQETMVEKRGRKPVLSPQDEEVLASHLRVLAKWGYGLSRDSVCDVAKEFCDANGIAIPWNSNKLNHDWFVGFSRRNDLSLKNTERLEKNRRVNTSNPFLIYEFYDLYEAELDKLELRDKPDQIFNLDECGVCNDPTRSRVVAGNEQKNLQRTDQGSGRGNTTVMGCVSAAGRCLPPLFIFRGARMWSTWKGHEDIPGTFYAVNESGFINTSIFYDFLVHFSRAEKKRPLMIVLDGHVSHLNYATVLFAQQENISIIKLPSHTTDIMQPLDRACFGPFKTHWNKKILEWQRLNQRIPSKSEFVDLVCSVWFTGLSSINICAGFRSCGLYPPDRNKYPVDRFSQTKLQQYLEQKSQKQLPVSESQHSSVADQQTDQSEPSVMELETNPSERSAEEQENLSSPNVIQKVSEHSVEEQENLSSTFSNVTQKVNFEDLLLKKIGSTAKPVAQRRLIPCNAAVITSQEFSEKIKELSEKPKRTARATKVADKGDEAALQSNKSAGPGKSKAGNTQSTAAKPKRARPKKCAQKNQKDTVTSPVRDTPAQLGEIIVLHNVPHFDSSDEVFLETPVDSNGTQKKANKNNVGRKAIDKTIATSGTGATTATASTCRSDAREDQVPEFDATPIFKSRNLGSNVGNKKRKLSQKENLPPASKKRTKFCVPYKKNK